MLEEGQSEALLEEQASQDLDIRLRGTEGMPKRPMCIGTERTRTHLLLCSVLLSVLRPFPALKVLAI